MSARFRVKEIFRFQDGRIALAPGFASDAPIRLGRQPIRIQLTDGTVLEVEGSVGIVCGSEMPETTPVMIECSLPSHLLIGALVTAVNDRPESGVRM